MRRLWHETSDIFWQCPIFWLPTLVADFVTFCFQRLWLLLRYEVIFRFMQRHSVLGNTPAYLIHGAVPTAATILLGFLRLFETFLGICFYTTAFLITAQLVSGHLQSSATEYRLVAAMLKKHRRSILVFSLKLFLLSVLAGVLAAEAVGFLTPRLNHLPLLYGVTAPYVAVFSAILLSACVAYIVTPSAVTLLRLPNSPPVKSEALAVGRTFAVVAVVVSSSAGIFSEAVERFFFRDVTHIHPIALQAIYAIASLLTAFPYIVLFIALALIATGSIEESEVPVV